MINTGEIGNSRLAATISAMRKRLFHSLQHNWKSVVIFVPYFWLLLFFLAPFFIVLKISMAEATIASPPFLPMIEWADEGVRITIENCDGKIESVGTVKTTIKCEDGSQLTIPNAELVAVRVGIQKK